MKINKSYSDPKNLKEYIGVSNFKKKVFFCKNGSQVPEESLTRESKHADDDGDDGDNDDNGDNDEDYT